MSKFLAWLDRIYEPSVDTGLFGKFLLKSRVAKIILAALSLVAFAGMVWEFVGKVKAAFPPIPQPSILVILPDPDKREDGAFYQDGFVQKLGFQKALEDTEFIPGKLMVRYHYMKRDDSPDAILASMKEAYRHDGATFFVMTMSTKIADLRHHFEAWHNECVKNGQRAPVLIGTVASAPDLPNAAAGIVRWYIRSDEESALLAEYLRWRLGITHAAIFYISRTPSMADDAYGKRGMEVFRDRFEDLGGTDSRPYSVTASTAAQEVARFLRQSDWQEAQSRHHVGVFVVGYGDMVKNTLTELISNKFDGPIVCASTLSEPDWQPQDTTADEHIFTVLPRCTTPHRRFQGHERNMVFFFARKTLARVLQMTAAERDSSSFIKNWINGERDPQLDQEYLANGDTIVQLDVVAVNDLR